MQPDEPQPLEQINWRRVRARLDRAMRATEDALLLSPERARAVMEERARLLARVPEQTDRAAHGLQVLTFGLGRERYGMETRWVREVLPFTEYTLLPGAPDFVVGVTNLRGHILVVMDLRQFFGVPVKGLTDQSRILVLGDERAEFGVLADVTYEVVLLRPDQVLEPPATVAGVAREYLRGVTAEALILLDGSVLLHDPRLFIDQGEETGA